MSQDFARFSSNWENFLFYLEFAVIYLDHSNAYSDIGTLSIDMAVGASDRLGTDLVKCIPRFDQRRLFELRGRKIFKVIMDFFKNRTFENSRLL